MISAKRLRMRWLKPSDVDGFFRALAARAPCRMKIIVTEGAEGMLLGSTRPTRDIDFGICLRFAEGAREAVWEAVEAAIADAARKSKVAVQYAEDIDRWSCVALPDYEHHTLLYQRFGQLSVHLLEPAYWAVPKLARYLDMDVADVVAVLRAQRISWRTLARVCGKALRASPRSSALPLFRRQVEHFFQEHGRIVWGAAFKPAGAIAAFHKAASIRTTSQSDA